MTTTKQDAVPVEVINHPTPKRYSLRAAYRSAVLTSANPYQQIAGPDPLRKHITLSGVAKNVIICGSISQASDPNNQVTATPNPNGRFIPLGVMEWCIEGQQEVWVTAATSDLPVIVGYTIVREVPE